MFKMFSRRGTLRVVSALLLLAALQAVSQAAASSRTTFTAVQDTWIYSRPITTFGDSTMLVGTSADVGTLRSLVQFDLGTIPSDAVIDSAVLELRYYACSRSSGCADMPVSIHRLTRGWDEGTATWAEMGTASVLSAYATQVLHGLADTGRWVAWDATELVREWHSGVHANHGLALHGDQTAEENYKVFSTKEMSAEKAPRLIVEWHGTVATATSTPTTTPTPTSTPTATVATAFPTPSDTPTATSTVPSTSEPTATPTPTRTSPSTLEPTATDTPTVTATPQSIRVYVPLLLRS